MVGMGMSAVPVASSNWQRSHAVEAPFPAVFPAPVTLFLCQTCRPVGAKAAHFHRVIIRCMTQQIISGTSAASTLGVAAAVRMKIILWSFCECIVLQEGQKRKKVELV